MGLDDLIKDAVKTKNITHKNKMPEYMLKAAVNKGNINIDSGLKEFGILLFHKSF